MCCSILKKGALLQGLFEGAMYTFVFLWTPALSPLGEQIPHGFIFAMFMVASMAGSALAGKLLNSNYKPERYMQYVFLVAGLCLMVPALYHTVSPPNSVAKSSAGISTSGMIQCVAFCVFESMVGVFWPSMMTMRAHYLPEGMRSTLINFFRIPLNIFVCVVLYNVSSFPLGVMFGMCSLFLYVALLCQRQLAHITRHDASNKESLAEI